MLGEGRGRITRRDIAGLAALTALPALLFGLRWVFGQTFFWGDLLYLHYPWKAAAAERVLQGAVPLWNPYIYLGMPLAAEMQCAVWYPGSLPFYFFNFPTALAVFHTVHFGLVGMFSYLWLRRLGFSRAAAWGGAAVFMLCGSVVSRIPFLNHISTIMFFPALLLLARFPVLLGLVFALAFFGGYPTMLIGEIAAAWLLHVLIEGRGRRALRAARVWAAAAVLGLGLAACLFLPAAQLAAGSKRGQGMEAPEVLTWSFRPGDLVQLTAPPLIPAGEFSPTGLWWKTVYFGFGGCAAAAAGLLAAGPAAAAAAAGYIGAVLLILLGDGNPVSHFIWTYFLPLKYVRYPGNMAYLLLPAAALLIARGLHRRRWAWGAAAVIAVELGVYAAVSQPTVSKGYFADSGPLVRVLRRELDGHRYLLSPLALHWQRGAGGDSPAAFRDLKHRLYGLTNMPYHLESVGSFGEPLVPQPSYDFMDFIFSRPSLAEAARWLHWADVRILMTRDQMAGGALRYLGDSLWHIYANTEPVSRAYWFAEDAGGNIPAVLGRLPGADVGRGIPLSVERSRDERFSIAASFPRPGWVYVSEPLGPGWKVEVNGRAARTVPALRAFHRLRVPAGKWRAAFRYEPVFWRLGLWLTLLVLCGLTAYWYNRLLIYSAGQGVLQRRLRA
ncbi:MAG: hypothetical protein ABIJ96_05355 [Elusimicrobiota bacterium]